MKKLYIISVISVIMLCLCSCGNSKEVRYNAIYDTQTKQYISLSDTKEQVETILGEGSGQNNGPYGYNNGLTIWYDNDLNVTSMRIDIDNIDDIDDIADKQSVSVYKFMDNIICGMDGSKVAEIYPDIQNISDFFSTDYSNNVRKNNWCLSIIYDEMTGQYKYDYNCIPTAYAFAEIKFEDGQVTGFSLYKNTDTLSNMLKSKFK